ncbi:MAG: metallophosphoesterase family protein [Pirellulaceae bacterium]|nr:metallophosphoesterase family protein [Pirellulaceae bacterium]
MVCALATLTVMSMYTDALLAQDRQAEPVAVKPADYYQPTAMPDRIVLSLPGDPRSSMAVSWRTSTEVAQGFMEYGIAEANPYFSEKSKRVNAHAELLKTDNNTARFHTVKLDSLKPGQKYAYRVGDGANWSEWFHFKTASEKAEPFSFIYFGDAQNNIRSLWSRVIREAYTDAPKAAFLLHAGDLVNNAEADAEWGEWCGAGSWINAMMPNVAIPGNHEMAKTGSDVRRVSHHWRPQFELPLNGPPGLEETCYTLVYHNMRLIGLNSNEQQELQAKWLDKVLAENQSEWVVCTFHHPIFSTGKDRDNAQLRALWKPIIDKYKVDLVLQGHDHTYGRTGLHVPSSLKPAEKPAVAVGSSVAAGDKATATIPQTIGNVATGVQQVDSQTGTVYVVSVSGPKMYNLQRQSFMQRMAEDTQLYQIIRIDGRKLRFEARTAIGQLYDAFELVKQPGKINQLNELPPEVEEHLRPIKP